MVDDFSDGYIEFEEAVGRIQDNYNLTIEDLKEYMKMYVEAQKDE